jgi:hypothetical protein
VAFCRPDVQIREAPPAFDNVSAPTGDFLEQPLRNSFILQRIIN